MKVLILTLLLSIPIVAIGKGKFENSVLIKNGILLNKPQLKGYTRITNVANTFQQGIGYNLIWVTESGILLSGGLDIAYEKYLAKIQYPFNDFGFKEPNELNSGYEIKSTIYYVQPNISIGYRYKTKSNYSPEIRIGQYLFIPLNSKQFEYTSTEMGVLNSTDVNFIARGFLGNQNSSAVSELVNYINIGVSTPGFWKGLSKCTIGLQFQKKIFMQNNPLNVIDITYFDYYTFVRGREKFNGNHTSIGIVLGIVF